MTPDSHATLSPEATQILGPDFAAKKFSPEDTAILLEAIDLALAKLGLEPTAPLSRKDVMATITAAAKRVMNRPKLALFLLDRVAKSSQTRPAVVLLRLSALIATKDQDRAVQELQRLRASDDEPKPFSFNLFMRICIAIRKGQLVLDAAMHEVLWGPVEPDLIRQMQKLHENTTVQKAADIWSGALLALRSEMADKPESFRDGLQWSMLVGAYLACITASPKLKKYKQSKGLSLSAAEVQIMNHARQLSGLKATFDPTLINHAIQQGQSIVVLRSHGSVRGFVTDVLRTLELPLSLVGNGELPVQGPDDMHLVTSNPAELPFAFTKLAKQMRKGQRIVRIFPDGQQGSELREIDVLGKPVKIGMGGATLAYYGNAALFFASTRWTGSGFAVDFMPGPVIVPGTSREDCNQLFADFYAKGLTSVILGPPEDMGLRGGMWSQILRTAE